MRAVTMQPRRRRCRRGLWLQVTTLGGLNRSSTAVRFVTRTLTLLQAAGRPRTYIPALVATTTLSYLSESPRHSSQTRPHRHHIESIWTRREFYSQIEESVNFWIFLVILPQNAVTIVHLRAPPTRAKVCREVRHLKTAKKKKNRVSY